MDGREVLLRIGTVALRMGITARQVRNLIQSGKLPAIRLSERNIRVRLGDLEDYLRYLNSL